MTAGLVVLVQYTDRQIVHTVRQRALIILGGQKPCKQGNG